MSTPLLDALDVPPILAYELDDSTATPGLRCLGAVLALHGIAENGGLVGGGVDLVLRARAEFLRFRPTGYEELYPADGELWTQLDEAFFAIAPSDRLEAAVAARLAQIAPELASP